jgi:hypothetical protein
VIAMKERAFSLHEIAQAEKFLLDPQKRIVADFLLPYVPKVKPYLSIDTEDIQPQTEDIQPQDEEEVTHIELLSESLLCTEIKSYCDSTYFNSLILREMKNEIIKVSEQRQQKLKNQREQNHQTSSGMNIWAMMLASVVASVLVNISVTHFMKSKPSKPDENQPSGGSTGSIVSPTPIPIPSSTRPPDPEISSDTLRTTVEPFEMEWQPACGSPGPAKGKRWWPVKGPVQALDLVKNKFCGDAFITNKTLQVASFDNEMDAVNFVNTLNQQGLPYKFWVGEPSWR